MIPVSKPFLGEPEVLGVSEAVREGWISSAGPAIAEFEEKWADRCDRTFGVAVANGTVALQLAVRALGLRAGDEVIMPAFTIISCALAAIYNGCTPVLVDCERDSWCMDVSQVEARVTPRTRAIMPVHIYGHPVDMDAILDVAERHGLSVIEDAAEAHGAEYLSKRSSSSGWKHCGSLGTISTFSFYANKLVTTGEGGMVLTDDPILADSARSLRNLAFGTTQRFAHTALGFNFRMTNIQAALGVAQLQRFDDVVLKKRSIAARYMEALSGIDGLQLPTEAQWARNVYWMFGVTLDADVLGCDAARVIVELENRGIQTRPFFLGLHQQSALRDLGLFDGEAYPETERLSTQGFYLPSGPDITNDDLDKVVSELKAVLHA